MKKTSLIKVLGLALAMGLVFAGQTSFRSDQFDDFAVSSGPGFTNLMIVTPNQIVLTPNQDLVFYIYNVTGWSTMELDTLVIGEVAANSTTMSIQPIYPLDNTNIPSEDATVITEDTAITSFESPWLKVTYDHNTAATANIKMINLTLAE